MSAACTVTAFADLAVGQEVSISKQIQEADVEAFARLSGDYNPLHMEDGFAKQTSFRRRVVHGMLLSSYVSTLIGMRLPGPGALWTEQRFQWRAPLFIGDTVAVRLRVTHKSEGTQTVLIEVSAVNQNGSLIMEGSGAVKLLAVQKEERSVPLSERVALISGSAQGIGAAIATALAEAGATVVINYRTSADAANALRERIQGCGGRAMTYGADVTDAQAVGEMLLEASDRFGKPVDVLVNNAAERLTPKEIAKMAWEDVEWAFAAQLKAAFTCTQAVLPAMVGQRSGSIVNIGSSITWGVPAAQSAAAAMAKAALKSYTKSVALEYGPLGIRANLVSPGMTETDATAEVPERLRKLQAMQSPLRRLAAPEDIAAVVTFLCSGGSRHLTGVDIPVSGGMQM